jgi:predicted  nucleic acid-binding Zn-ribbon protein
MKKQCTKCGQVITSPPLNNQCPKGGNHSWVDAKSNQSLEQKFNYKNTLKSNSQ